MRNEKGSDMCQLGIYSFAQNIEHEIICKKEYNKLGNYNYEFRLKEKESNQKRYV